MDPFASQLVFDGFKILTRSETTNGDTQQEQLTPGSLVSQETKKASGKKTPKEQNSLSGKPLKKKFDWFELEKVRYKDILFLF